MREGLQIINNFLTNSQKKNKIGSVYNKTKKDLNNIFKRHNTQDNFFNVLRDNFKLNFNISDIKKFSKFRNIVIIGMGGSVLGTKAIYTFLYKRIKKNLIIIDNLDNRNLYKIKKLKKEKKLFILVSKSGNTLETLSNINLLSNFINKSKNTIIISENQNSALSIFAKKNNIKFVEHKKYIGGRFSVLTEVGMLPAYLMGLKINLFRKNLFKFFQSEKKFISNSVSILSQIYLSKKIKSIVLINYNSEFLDFNFWCQQLISESLGKKGKGLFPVVSQAPKDHHSLLQLYLDGPKDKIFYVFSGENTKSSKIKKNIFGSPFDFLKNKTLNKIINSQKNAFISVLQKKKIPFREFIVKDFSEKTLGKMFAYFMVETIMLGKAIKINPFDQPGVEQVKIITKKNLNK
jgi:glucose-6-phosphate isomerase